jgi:hypothetical protein
MPFIQKLNYKVKNKHCKWIKVWYMSHIKQLWTSTQHVTWHFHKNWLKLESVCQQLIKMPFTIHLNPGVILPIQTSVHVSLFLLLLYFVLTLIIFQFWAKFARVRIAQKSVTLPHQTVVNLNDNNVSIYNNTNAKIYQN